jgi:SAM-dependent methyltransferase
MMLVDLSHQGYEVFGIDSSQDAVDYCRKRNLPVKNCSISKTDLPAESFDCVLLLDVLEHLDSEPEVLVEAEKILKKGGLLICTVPSYKWLWTERDNFHHHKRRYCRKQLSNLFVSLTNMQILILSYMNTFLFPIAAVARLYQKLFPSNKEPCDLFIPAMGINKIFRAVFAGERFFINNKISLPFGVSLILVARKK